MPQLLAGTGWEARCLVLFSFIFLAWLIHILTLCPRGAAGVEDVFFFFKMNFFIPIPQNRGARNAVYFLYSLPSLKLNCG